MNIVESGGEGLRLGSRDMCTVPYVEIIMMLAKQHNRHAALGFWQPQGQRQGQADIPDIATNIDWIQPELCASSMALWSQHQ